MNQILYTGKNDNNKMNKNIIFYAVIIIVFAICLIALGVYLFSRSKATINEQSNNNGQTINNNDPKDKKEIEILFSSIPGVSGKVQVKVTGPDIFKTATYRWDNGEEQEIEFDEGSKEIIAQIATGYGSHTLYISVEDVEGNTLNRARVIQGDVRPEIKITTDQEFNYVVKVKAEDTLQKVTVDVNGTIVDVPINGSEVNYKTPIPEGDSIITVTATSKSGLETVKKAQIKGF